MFGFNQRRSAIVADAVMATWHDERIFLRVETDQTFFLLLVLFHHLLLSRNSLVLAFHSIDRFQLERKPIYQHYLFQDSRSCYQILTILSKDTVTDHRVGYVVLGVID